MLLCFLCSNFTSSTAGITDTDSKIATEYSMKSIDSISNILARNGTYMTKLVKINEMIIVAHKYKLWLLSLNIDCLEERKFKE